MKRPINSKNNYHYAYVPDLKFYDYKKQIILCENTNMPIQFKNILYYDTKSGFSEFLMSFLNLNLVKLDQGIDNTSQREIDEINLNIDNLKNFINKYGCPMIVKKLTLDDEIIRPINQNIESIEAALTNVNIDDLYDIQLMVQSLVDLKALSLKSVTDDIELFLDICILILNIPTDFLFDEYSCQTFDTTFIRGNLNESIDVIRYRINDYIDSLSTVKESSSIDCLIGKEDIYIKSKVLIYIYKIMITLIDKKYFIQEESHKKIIKNENLSTQCRTFLEQEFSRTIGLPYETHKDIHRTYIGYIFSDFISQLNKTCIFHTKYNYLNVNNTQMKKNKKDIFEVYSSTYTALVWALIHHLTEPVIYLKCKICNNYFYSKKFDKSTCSKACYMKYKRNSLS